MSPWDPWWSQIQPVTDSVCEIFAPTPTASSSFRHMRSSSSISESVTPDMAPMPAVAIEPKAMEEGKMISEAPLQINESTSSPGLNELDYEKHGAGRESTPVPDLKRKLKSRHLQMIAIG